MSTRRIYASSNGDTWDLVKNDKHVFVRHTPNEASGGKPSSLDLGAFLSSNLGSPQHEALLEMVGSLTLLRVDELKNKAASNND